MLYQPVKPTIAYSQPTDVHFVTLSSLTKTLLSYNLNPVDLIGLNWSR